MLISWFKRRRRRALRGQPFPALWDSYLQQNVRHIAGLSAEELRRLRKEMLVFIAEKNWEGCGGLEMTDEIKVTVAAQVCYLTLGFESSSAFDHVLSILVYPAGYVAPETRVDRAGVVIEEDSGRLGEAWYGGPVILSWADVLAAGRGRTNGSNLVFHEFAHQLDLANGQSADGVPIIEREVQYERWSDVVAKEYQKLIHDCQHGLHPLLDCYGSTSPAEFFAVATEYFFERPGAMQKRHPKLYDILKDYFRQDPASRAI